MLWIYLFCNPDIFYHSTCSKLDYSKNPDLSFDISWVIPETGRYSFHQLVSLDLCFKFLQDRRQKVSLIGLNTSELYCAPSLRSTDCHLVIHDCKILKLCQQDFLWQFQEAGDGHFQCQEAGYERPTFIGVLIPQVKAMHKYFDTELNQLVLVSPICADKFPSLKFVIRRGMPYCHELIITPQSRCDSFLLKCEEMMLCLIENKADCAPSQVFTPFYAHDHCKHWALTFSNIKFISSRFATLDCTARVITTNLTNQCNYQKRLCGEFEHCLRHWNCSLPNMTNIDCTDWFHNVPPLPRNDMNVFRCNKQYGFHHGISLSYIYSKWLCKMSYRAYHLSCEEVMNICKKMVRCLEERQTFNLEEADEKLQLSDCEGPLEASRTKELCIKIPVILKKDSHFKYLKDCTYAQQQDLEFYTEQQPHDTLCCKSKAFHALENPTVLSTLNCTTQEQVCGAIMACYINFESNILNLLEIFDTSSTRIVHFIACIIGIFNNVLSFNSDLIAPKMYQFLKTKLLLEIGALLMVTIFVSFDFAAKLERAPAQVKWFKDGILKWLVYIFLSLQSVSTITNCFYLALITKYPLIAKEIKSKLSQAFFIAVGFCLAYHVPRLFLDLVLSASLCSLVQADSITFSYSLEYQSLKHKIAGLESSEISTIKDADDFFRRFHESCRDYFQSVQTSQAFLIYNVVLDSLFCHLVPIAAVIVSMTIFVIEIAKLIRRRNEMNFEGKKLRVINVGTVVYFIQAVAMAIRHTSMVVTSFYIWYHDQDNIFLTATLEEQFAGYMLVSVVTFTLSNILITVAFATVRRK